MNVAMPLKGNAIRFGRRGTVAAGVFVAVTVFVVGLLWAKWLPYAAKATAAHRTHHWSASSILTVGGVRAGDGPSWHAAATFFHAYLWSIWPALVAALLISASVQALLPPSWLPRALNRRRPLFSAVAGGAAGMPSMMCTCCAAPVAVTLRRNGITPAAAIAYWLGNPLLNPAVLVFLLFVAPWQWSLTRLIVGLAAVLGIAAVVGVISRAPGGEPEPLARDGEATARPRGFVRALLWLGVFLLPEYAVLVLLLGAFRGVLLTLGQPAHRGVLAGLLIVAVVAIAGTLMVIPTAGEIPILLGLSLLGASSGTIGALLITLPAVSVPGAAMVARTFGWKAVATATGGVIAAGLAGAAVLSLL